MYYTWLNSSPSICNNQPVAVLLLPLEIDQSLVVCWKFPCQLQNLHDRTFYHLPASTEGCLFLSVSELYLPLIQTLSSG